MKPGISQGCACVRASVSAARPASGCVQKYPVLYHGTVPRNPVHADTYPVRYDSQSVISRSRPALTPSTGSQSGSATPGTRVQRLRAEDRAGTPRSFTTHQHANGHTSRQAQCIHVHGKQVCSVLSSFVSNIRVTRDGAARAARAGGRPAPGASLGASPRAREQNFGVCHSHTLLNTH